MIKRYFFVWLFIFLSCPSVAFPLWGPQPGWKFLRWGMSINEVKQLMTENDLPTTSHGSLWPVVTPIRVVSGLSNSDGKHQSSDNPYPQLDFVFLEKCAEDLDRLTVLKDRLGYTFFSDGKLFARSLSRSANIQTADGRLRHSVNLLKQLEKKYGEGLIFKDWKLENKVVQRRGGTQKGFFMYHFEEGDLGVSLFYNGSEEVLVYYDCDNIEESLAPILEEYSNRRLASHYFPFGGSDLSNEMSPAEVRKIYSEHGSKEFKKVEDRLFVVPTRKQTRFVLNDKYWSYIDFVSYDYRKYGIEAYIDERGFTYFRNGKFFARLVFSPYVFPTKAPSALDKALEVYTELTTLDASQTAGEIERNKQLEELILAISPRMPHNLADWVVYKHGEGAYGENLPFNCIAPFVLFNRGVKDLFGGYSLSLTHFLDTQSVLVYFDVNALRMLDHEYWDDVDQENEAGVKSP